jgi:hypothetical protein
MGWIKDELVSLAKNEKRDPDHLSIGLARRQSLRSQRRQRILANGATLALSEALLVTKTKLTSMTETASTLST